MKIALFTHELGLNGAPRALLNMSKCFIELGCEVDLYSPFDGPIRDSFTNCGVNVCIKNDLFGTKEIDNDLSYDLIVYNTIVSLISAENTKKWKGKKIIWIHEGAYCYDIFGKPTVAYGLNRAIDYRKLIGLVDEIYCVSEWSANTTRKYTDKEIKILPYYIEEENINRSHKDSKGLYIGLIGTVEARKGVYFLSEALKKLPSDVHVISIGKAINPVFNDKILYLGCQKHDFVLSAYNKFDLLICPSEDDPMPIVCAEAFMLGCPVFVSQNTGTSALIEDKFNGVTFEYSVNGIINAIKWAYSHKFLLEDIGERGRNIYKNNFTYNKFKENITNLL